mgnify:CR=1 FL=1
MDILGISAFYHDAAAALVRDGEIVAAAQEERFTRKKHDPSFPANAARWCLEEAGTRLSDIDAVVFYEKPLLKFERLLTSYAEVAPRGIRQFVAAMPGWLTEKIAARRSVREGLAKVDPGATRRPPLWFGGHHRSHAASAFFPSPYDHAAVLTVDGVGEWATATIGEGKGNRLRLLRELHWPDSVGMLYSAFTYWLGFRVNSGEYKLMGLAPYGDPDSQRTRAFQQTILDRLVQVREDGSIRLDRRRFAFETGLKMVRDGDWDSLFGFPRRRETDEILPHHADLALAIQRVLEDIVLRMAVTARTLTGARHLCLAGGVALNCVANGVLRDRAGFEGIWIQPAAGDAGGALGAALDAWHTRRGGPRESAGTSDRMAGGFLGPGIDGREVHRVARRYGAPNRRFDDPAGLCQHVAGLLADGKVVGWVQGRMEWGPRALGNRSILADPRDPEMQRRLNLKIKFREGFRPFAPAVMAGKAAEWFSPGCPSPYMLFTAQVRPERRRDDATRGLAGHPWREQLYVARSEITAVTHVDGSARLQTVHEETNPLFHRLLQAFESRTGCPVLVNTSFNVRGEPIVCSPDDAYRCFLNTGIDILVMGDRVFLREDQPEEARRSLKVGAGTD